MNNPFIEGAALVILATRDFMGDENEALNDFAFDNNVTFSTTEKNAIKKLANEMWQESQIDAGVFAPISNEERRQIFNVIERA